jgi:histidine triad (HIT) family protein
MQEPQACIFCRVSAGELPSYRIYEDEWVIALLDIHPVNRGHTLVIPKQHFENVFDIPEDLMIHIYRIAKKVAEAQKRALNPDGIGIAQNNGAAAGQVIFHFHTHIIPKNGQTHDRYDATPEELSQVAELIRKNMVV